MKVKNQLLNTYFIKGESIDVNLLLVALIAFCIPLSKKIIPFLIIILVLHYIITSLLSKKFVIAKKTLIAYCLFYIVYAFSLLYSSNISFGLFDLEIKLSLFLFPLLFFTKEHIFQKNHIVLFVSFIAGCLTATLLCFAQSVYQFFESKSISEFFYSNLSVFHHTSYFSMYLNFAVVLLLVLSERKIHSSRQAIVYWFFCIYFSLFILLLSSKTTFITLMFTYVIFFIYKMFEQKKHQINFFLKSLLPILIVVLIFLFSGISDRYQSLFKTIKNTLNNEYVEYDSTVIRIEAWRSSLSVIQSNFLFGVGVGDVKDKLMDTYSERGAHLLLERKTNSHNQFLQTFIATGFLGFLSLILLLAYPFIIAIQQKNYLHLAFIGIVFINFLTESMLETQAGVVFFAFFHTLLFQYKTMPSKKCPVDKNPRSKVPCKQE